MPRAPRWCRRQGRTAVAELRTPSPVVIFMRLAGWGGVGPLVLSRCHATSRLSPTSLLRCRGNREENPSHSHCRSSSVDAAGTRGSCGAGLQTSPSATAAVAARLNLHAMAGDWFERERNGNRGRIGFGRFGLGYGGNDGVPTRRSCISKEGTTAGSGDGGGVGRGVATGSGRWRRSAFGLEGVRRWRLVGRLLYLTATRPNIAYAIQQLSQYVDAPTTEHMATAHRVLRYIKKSPRQGLFYPKQSDAQLTVFSDSDWASCSEK
nr:uncharacterized protein LOC109150899 [Ipomoea batatas]